jgi:hypothetical protein
LVPGFAESLPPQYNRGSRMISIRIPIKELFWLIPFICLGLLSLSLLRPAPVFSKPNPTQSRYVEGADGVVTALPVPLQGIVGGGYDFLQKTHSPELLAKAGSRKDRPKYGGGLLDWVHPLVIKDERMWDFPTDIESILANDRGYVYLSDGRLRIFGLPSVSSYPNSRDIDEVISGMTRKLNEVIDQKDNGEILVANYFKSLNDFSDELNLETLTERPRLIGMVCSTLDWSHVWSLMPFDKRLGLPDPTERMAALGRESEAERILAVNPDIIILFVGETKSFLRDPRWKGLKAVQERKVYQNITSLNGYALDLDNRPLAIRWVGEIAYPQRLKPKLRILLRDHYENNYGYRLKDYEIDWLLHMEENEVSAGYERFRRQEK